MSDNYLEKKQKIRLSEQKDWESIQIQKKIQISKCVVERFFLPFVFSKILRPDKALKPD